MTQPFKKVEQSMTTHVVVYVPSTIRNSNVSPKEFQNRIDEVTSYLTRIFGGTTKITATGTYTGKSGKVTKERMSKIEIFTKPDEWEAKKDNLYKFLKLKKKAWKQEEMAVEYEEDMFWV